MKDKVDIASLEGWLIKKKSPTKQNVLRILSGDTRRWFQVKELRCSDRVEITLCYFKSPYETEARGWIYLNDVTQLSEDGKSIKIVSFARTITVEAKSRAEHNYWFEGISSFCPSINRSGCKGDSSTFVDETLRNLTCSSRVALQGNSHDQKAEGKSIRKINRTDHKHARSGESKEVYKTSSLINSTKSSASSAATDTDITLNGVSSGSKNRGNGTDNSVGKEDHRIGKLSSGESTGATDRLHNHIRKSPLITSHDTEMQGEASEFSLHQSTASGIYEHSCTYDNSNDDDDKIDTVNISIESSVARNNDRRNMRDSGYYNAKSQQISQSSMDQKEPLLYERRKRFMQPTSIYSDTVGDSGDNDAERISTSEPIRNPSGRVMEYSEVRKINIQVDKGYFFRRRGEVHSASSSDEEHESVIDLKTGAKTDILSGHEGKEIDLESGLTSQASPVSSEGSVRIVVVRGKPPLAPNPYTSILKMQPCLLSQPKVGRRVATTTDYANDDWDDFDDDNDYEDHNCGFKETSSSLTDENVMKSEMITGVPADSNWLHENFDED